VRLARGRAGQCAPALQPRRRLLDLPRFAHSHKICNAKQSCTNLFKANVAAVDGNFAENPPVAILLLILDPNLFLEDVRR